MKRNRAGLLAAAAILLMAGAGLPMTPASAQTATKTEQQAPAKKPAPEAVETTKPSEQTKQVADGVIVPDYRDDRSTPQALVESFYNAINRREYARAYDYFSVDGREPEFKSFVKGYENTRSVKVAVRKVEPDPGAGQIYWSQPLAIEAEKNDGSREVFTGCYTVLLTNPSMQEVPPFKPMQIVTGSLTKSPLALEKSVPEGCEAP